MAEPNALTDRQREYREVYLQSDHWRETRAKALERAEHRCQVCNSAKQLDVHHRTYERLGHERPADLTVLCRTCHGRHHDDEGQRVVRLPAGKRPGRRQRKNKKRKGPGKGALAHDIVAMKQRNARGFMFGPMTAEPVGFIEDRGYVMRVSTEEYELRIFAAKNGKSLRVWAVPGNEMVETDAERPAEPWAWHLERLQAQVLSRYEAP